MRFQSPQRLEVGDPRVTDGVRDQVLPGVDWLCSNQRRCVTPLVLLLNRSGHSW